MGQRKCTSIFCSCSSLETCAWKTYRALVTGDGASDICLLFELYTSKTTLVLLAKTTVTGKFSCLPIRLLATRVPMINSWRGIALGYCHLVNTVNMSRHVVYFLHFTSTMGDPDPSPNKWAHQSPHPKCHHRFSLFSGLTVLVPDQVQL